MAKRVVIRGRVQGVFFRDSLRHQAQARRVAGWVRNADDGSVEALLAGPDEDVEALVAWCRTGPPQASVESVAVSDAGGQDAGTGFSVR